MFCFAFSLILYVIFFFIPNPNSNFLLCSFTFILLFDGDEKILIKIKCVIISELPSKLAFYWWNFFCNKCIGLRNFHFRISFLIYFLSSLEVFRFIVPYSTQDKLVWFVHILLSWNSLTTTLWHSWMSSLNYCEVISSPYTLDGFRLFCCRRPFCLKVLWVLYYFGRNNSKLSHNYNLLCNILPDWLAASLPRWLTSLEVFEFYHWYYVTCHGWIKVLLLSVELIILLERTGTDKLRSSLS